MKHTIFFLLWWIWWPLLFTHHILFFMLACVCAYFYVACVVLFTCHLCVFVWKTCTCLCMFPFICVYAFLRMFICLDSYIMPCPLSSVLCQTEMVIYVFHVAGFSLFLPPYILNTLTNAIRPPVGKNCFHTVSLRRVSVVTNLTVWLNSWVVCWLFVCHLTRWQTDWLSALLTEWLTGC